MQQQVQGEAVISSDLERNKQNQCRAQEMLGIHKNMQRESATI